MCVCIFLFHVPLIVNRKGNIMDTDSNVLCRLQLQYRMHAAISRFPGQFFYENNLKDGVRAEDRQAVHHGKV
jgi:superfamily I DNA and/or RNA helicase